MELIETVEKMQSKDYKERFIAEYEQLCIRIYKLNTMLIKWSKGLLMFTPTCPRAILTMQLNAMVSYMQMLEVRAQIEKIELPKLDFPQIEL